MVDAIEHPNVKETDLYSEDDLQSCNEWTLSTGTDSKILFSFCQRSYSFSTITDECEETLYADKLLNFMPLTYLDFVQEDEMWTDVRQSSISVLAEGLVTVLSNFILIGLLLYHSCIIHVWMRHRSELKIKSSMLHLNYREMIELDYLLSLRVNHWHKESSRK